jgi:hypothetical protein
MTKREKFAESIYSNVTLHGNILTFYRWYTGNS